MNLTIRTAQECGFCRLLCLTLRHIFHTHFCHTKPYPHTRKEREPIIVSTIKNENAVVQIHDDYIEDIDENAARIKEILTKAQKRRRAAAKPAAAQRHSYAPQL